MKYLFLLGCSLAVAAPAWAQDAASVQAKGDEANICTGTCMTRRVSDNAQTILVTGSPANIYTAGRSVSVVGSAELDSVQGPDLTRVLERLPGVTLARSGGLGSQTSLFVRGANSEQVVVTIDGVRVADVAAPSGGFDFGTLLSGGISKIELLRGSNSVIWGSDAMGGVLAVTRAGIDGASGSAEYGSYESLTANARAGLLRESYDFSVDGGYARSDGISAFAGGAEADPFKQWTVGGSGRIGLTRDLHIVANLRHTDSTVDFDGYPAPLYIFGDTPEFQETRQTAGRAGFVYDGKALNLRGGIGYSSTKRAYFDPTFGATPGFETDGRSLRADFAGAVTLTNAVSLDFGAESDWTRFSTSFDPQREARLSSGYAQLGFTGNRLSLAAGARLNDHDRFGSKWTLGANGSFDLGGGWRFRASWGQGFKAPTLYQLYGFGGNTALKPETSNAFDAGLELGDRNGGYHFAATVFTRDSSNLISYVWPTGYFNIGKARARGFELEGGARVSEQFSVRAAYSYIQATNRTTGNDLARRPRHALSASADWTTPLGGLALGADMRLVGDSFDDAGNFTAIDGHAVLTLRASVPIGERFELYGRVENVTDESYQTVSGYGTYGRSAYAGVRIKW